MQMQVFSFDSHSVRTQTDGEVVWFNANDVCVALGFGNPRDAVERHVDQDDVGKRDTIDSLGRTQSSNHINESGLYALIFGSTLPNAKAFKRWVTSEVLPAIRKTGKFEVSKPVVQLPDFKNPAEAARAWALEYEGRIQAEATKAEIGHRREATAMNTASQAVKKVNKLEIELDKSKEYATVKRMEMQYHGTKFSWRLLKSTATEMDIPAIDVFDANYGTVKAYHSSVWLEAYAVSVE